MTIKQITAVLDRHGFFSGRMISPSKTLYCQDQLFRKNEGTWGVIFDEVYYHNFDLYRLQALSFLDKPILSAYVIWPPLWRWEQWPGPKPIAVPKTKLGKLTLRNLMSEGLVPKITR